MDARGNDLDGGAGDDYVSLAVRAGATVGGTGGGASSATTTQYYNDPFAIGWTHYVHGNSGDGGDGGAGGDARAIVGGNALTGGDGDDQLQLTISVRAGFGGSSGASEAGRTDYSGTATHEYFWFSGVSGTPGAGGLHGVATSVVSDNVLSGGAGDDTITVAVAGGTTTVDGNVIDGGTGLDRLVFTGTTHAVAVDLAADRLAVAGGPWNDLFAVEHVVGGDMSDSLAGAGGDDTLAGGGGIDTLTGRGGADVFLFQNVAGRGRDTVTDFVHGEDRIGLETGAVAFAAWDTDGDGRLEAGEGRGGPAVALNGDALTLTWNGGSLALTNVAYLTDADFA